MSGQHTQGKLGAFTEDRFSGWWALCTDEGEMGSGDGGFEEADARRLAACWNAFDAPCMTTEMVETLIQTGGVDALAEQAAAAFKELAAARALLEQVAQAEYEFDGDDLAVVIWAKADAIRAFLKGGA
jgi:hypothetical protein